MYLQPKNFEEPETFFCRAYGKRHSVFDCMSDFVDANALNWKDKPCFKCVQGEENRLMYAKS
jgi:hypothetical protein